MATEVCVCVCAGFVVLILFVCEPPTIRHWSHRDRHGRCVDRNGGSEASTEKATEEWCPMGRAGFVFQEWPDGNAAKVKDLVLNASINFQLTF